MSLSRASAEASREGLARPTSRLDEALAGLSSGERYNVVLQGMLRRCRGAGARQVLEVEAWPLLEEMAGSGARISADTRSALVDAAAATDDASAMERCSCMGRENLYSWPQWAMSPLWSRAVGHSVTGGTVLRSLRLARKTGAMGGFSRYAAEQGSIPLLPSDPRRRGAMLESLPTYPTDDRSLETALGLSLLGAAAVAGLWGPILAPLSGDPDAWNPGAIFLVLAALAGGADVFLGDGGVAGKVLGGLSRLFTRDPARECRCEAASFSAAYLLGLPAFALAPTAVEALR